MFKGLLLFLFIFPGITLYGASLKVASVQMPVTGNMEANFIAMKQAVVEAKKNEARVVVFPETVLSGFFAEDVKNIDWNELHEKMNDLAALAKANNLYLIYGSATKSSYEKPYNSALVINPEGKCIEEYHKSFPESYFEPGEKLALFIIDSIPCTMIICHDSRYPELVRVPVMAGARICFYPSYEVNGLGHAQLKREGYMAQSCARAVENNIWYVQANGVGPFEGNNVSLGNSVIVNNYGHVVAKAPEMKPAILYATIDINLSKPQNSTALRGETGKFLGDWNKMALDELLAQKKAEEFASVPKQSHDSIIRLALMQTIPEKWNLDKNFETFLKLLDDSKNADIFVTPECWLDGYAAADKSSTPDKLRAIAQDLNSSNYLQRVSQEAKKRQMYICFGFTSLENGKVFNAAGLWDKSGKLVGVYHKTHLQTHDLQFEKGEGLPVWDTSCGKVGIMICADRRWPETARTLRLKGAHLILNPTYGMHHLANEWWMRTRGYENQCFIAFAHPDVGFVVGPKGNLVAKRTDNPGILICDIDITQSKDDNHIQDRRPDIYFK